MSEEFELGGDSEFDGLENIPKVDVVRKYKSVFINPMGLEVLSDLLSMCHFGSTLDSSNPQQIGEYNIGVAILAKCGVFGGDRMNEIVKSLCSIIPLTGNKEVVR
jgi:hypothetical protein